MKIFGKLCDLHDIQKAYFYHDYVPAAETRHTISVFPQDIFLIKLLTCIVGPQNHKILQQWIVLI